MMNLQGQFLIATLDMNDDYFDRAVIYICEHNEHGAMGIMINSPTDLSVMELLAKMDFLMANERNYTKDQLVLSGGPVGQERGFILHTATDQLFLHSYPTADDLMLTTSGDILDTFGRQGAPADFIVCLGCCTWKADQLEQEIARNYWVTAPASHKILFETGYLDRWSEANALLGIEGILAKAGRA
ncbi:YqgE/AlgH family protein [Glaesserella parasuis]|uniref:YqgE/AlgH family protein n=1 Tax=Glaesserella parasuis TaxID=738 RepID=UPI0013DF30A1|nr:YqgE/AlgH family protein [Glaesserella parasuis]QIE74270.1 YqgE/AlgH family protein [Glaesserella parasuis]